MKKIFAAIILGAILIPQLTWAQGLAPSLKLNQGTKDEIQKAKVNDATDTSVNADQLPDAQTTDLNPGKKFGQTKCKWTKIDDAPECLTPDERKNFQYIVLEEQMQISEQVNEYTAGESQIRSCQRMIQVSNCAATGEPAEIKSNTKYVKDGECTPIPKDGNNDRVICEDVTVIMSPLTTGGSGLLSTYVGFIYRWAAGIVGVIAVFIIILNSILIITAQDDQGAMDEAKKRIFQALAGIAILFLSSLILYAINPDFFQL